MGVMGRRRGGASGGGVVAVRLVARASWGGGVAAIVAVVAVRLVARWRWPITTHDTFISSKARNAQYSTTLPYVKSRQIAKNRLVFPNCTLIANRRSRKVLPCPYI